MIVQNTDNEIEQTDIYVGKGRVKENVLVRMAGRL